MAVKASSRASRNVVQLARPTLRETIARLAPGTALRDGLERILRGRTGALIVIGYDDSVEAICDGGQRSPHQLVFRPLDGHALPTWNRGGSLVRPGAFVGAV